jgi:hypothetical protein
LGTQIPARVRQATAGELESRIGPQMMRASSKQLANECDAKAQAKQDYITAKADGDRDGD